MSRIRQLLKIIISGAVFAILIIGVTPSVKAEEIAFTREEMDCINSTKVLKAVSIDGIAPLSYRDSKGTIKGIGVSILDSISHMTGLAFEYELYDSIADSLESGFDIYFNAAHPYAPDDMVLSRPYLVSETILYLNSSVDPQNLDSKVFAAIRGGTLPEGITEKRTVYFDDREGAIDAVETGKADYGYGNAYSVAFYTLQNGYKNIVTIPQGKERREYCIGVPKGNKTLLSIINKSVESIGEQQMQTFVLDVAAYIERKITFSMIMGAYGKEIFAVILFVVSILLFSLALNASDNKILKMQNKRYESLARISNECLFEYYIKTKSLKLTFRETDITGRIGGDEFCVYMKNVPSADFVKNKFRQLNETIEDINPAFAVSLSAGVMSPRPGMSYQDIFQEADDALYQAKRGGRAQVVIHGEALL